MKIMYFFFGVLGWLFVVMYSPSCKTSLKANESDSLKVDSATLFIPNDTLGLHNKLVQINTYFDTLYHQDIFNGNVLIAQEGQILYEKSFGYSNYHKKDTLTGNETFQLASISKQFTVIAIMMLQEKGMLEYSDSVQKFFPGFPFHNITVHMLLCHRSGLPNYIYFCDDVIKNKDTSLSNREVIDLFELYKPMWYYPPDSRFNYSNTNYMLLASIVEKVSGLPFETFMNKNVFQRIGMTNTIIYNRNKPADIPNRTTGYLYRWHEAEDNFLNGVIGDKGVYTTTHDMLKWHEALFTDTLVSRESLQKAFQPYSFDREEKSNYGYGWRLVFLENGEKLIYHRGWWQGYQNLYARINEKRTAIIVLSNRKTKFYVDYKVLLNILIPGTFRTDSICSSGTDSVATEEKTVSGGVTTQSKTCYFFQHRVH